MANVKIDLSAIDELKRDLKTFRDRTLYEVANRGRTLLQIEVPKVTKELERGVKAPFVEYEKGKATITVSAVRARRGSRDATLHLKSGKTKSIKLRPQKEYDYAEAATGRRPAPKPKTAKVLIIPVSTAPSGESYIQADGQIFIVRRTAKAARLNPYDERAAKRLQGEVVTIVEAVKKQVLK